MKIVGWYKNKSTLTLSVENKNIILTEDSDPESMYNKCYNMIKEGKNDELYNLLTLNDKKVKIYEKEGFKTIEDIVFINDEPLPTILGERLLEYADAGLPCESLVNFWKRVKNNPSQSSVAQLFGFLEANRFTLTSDGCFIGYKRVRANLKDIRTGTFDNSPGQKPNMKREDCNHNPKETCSYGLHVASWHYLTSGPGDYTDRTLPIVECKVDPANVVSVPTDYDQSKMRVCEYEVLSVSPGEPIKRLVYDKDNCNLFQVYDLEDDEKCPRCGSGDWGDSYLCEDCEEELEDKYGDEEDDFEDYEIGEKVEIVPMTAPEVRSIKLDTPVSGKRGWGLFKWFKG